MTKVKLGDMTIELRDWPTPDANKCSRAADLAIGLWTTSPGMVTANGHSDGTWNAHSISVGARPDVDFIVGWFWLSNPAELTWVDNASGPWVIYEADTPAGNLTFVLKGPIPNRVRPMGTRNFGSLEEAKQMAADFDRERLTRREP